MATGSGIPQSGAIVTADETPSYAIPHDNAIANAVQSIGANLQPIADGMLKEHYEQVGAKEGAAVAAGTQKYNPLPVITDVGQARQNAVQGAYLAGIKTDIDNHIDQTVRANPLNPAAFKAAADPIVSGYVKGAPGPFAQQVNQYATAKANSAFQSLSDQKVTNDQNQSVTGVNARQQSLSDTMLSLAAAGQEAGPAYKAASDEWMATNTAKVQNPLFSYPVEQATRVAAMQQDQIQGASSTYHATQAYTSAGGGEAGLLAAKNFLQTSFLEPGGPMADMAPDKRLKLYATALANVRDLDKADAETRAIAAEQARQVHSDQRDNAGILALGIVDGSASEADVHAAEAAHKIEPGAAAHIILGARAQARSAAAQSRLADTADRNANYGALKEMADAGTLTPAAIAANGGNLLPLQRDALRAATDKQTRPAVANITRLASSAFKENGVVGDTSVQLLENLKIEAHQWALNNPQATIGQQTGFASAWVQKHKGIVIGDPMSSNAAAVLPLSQVAANYRAKFHGQNISQNDVDNAVATYKAAHPTAR